MKSFLVTGGAGFVGSHLALRLKAAHAGARVIALDNLRRRGSELNVPRLKACGVDFLHGDIRTPGDIAEAGNIDALIECSAEPSVLAGFGESPEYVVQTNLVGTLNCLEWARRRGAAVIFLSTSRVYPMAALRALHYRERETRVEPEETQRTPGAGSEGISEEFPLAGTRSLYGATKLASELIMQEYLEMYSMRGVINRCGVLSGAWQMGKVDQGVVVLWMARHVYGGRLKYIGYGGTGKQVRDVLHVNDLCDLVEYQLAHLDTLNGQVFNVGGGRANSASLQELTALCQEVTGKTLDIETERETRTADIPYYVSDHRKVTAATGWQPSHTLRETLTDIHAWILAQKELLRPILE
ncbi:MAG: NAD-dependent epimerase/dehydratase family protein [Candidatus Hydrogenedentes bacterium]|nr:NAD-dependent epimerase/dehydratase family protein [Candidatus Hydrogenedentota bacterium]